MSGMREMLEGAIGFFEAKPDRAAMTSKVSCKLVGPTETHVRSRDHVVVTDEPEYAGGSDAGAPPAELALMALASCSAVAFRYWSALLDVPFDSVEVEVEGDLDRRGALGFEGVRPGYTDVRMILHVEGAAGQVEYQRVFERSNAACPVSDMLKSPVNVTCEVQTA